LTALILRCSIRCCSLRYLNVQTRYCMCCCFASFLFALSRARIAASSHRGSESLGFALHERCLGSNAQSIYSNYSMYFQVHRAAQPSLTSRFDFLFNLSLCNCVQTSDSQGGQRPIPARLSLLQSHLITVQVVNERSFRPAPFAGRSLLKVTLREVMLPACLTKTSGWSYRGRVLL